MVHLFFNWSTCLSINNSRCVVSADYTFIITVAAILIIILCVILITIITPTTSNVPQHDAVITRHSWTIWT